MFNLKTYIKDALSQKRYKQSLLILSTIIVAAGVLIYSIYSHFYLSTDDAYVNANVVQISARVTGQVQHLYVVDNQFVKQNDLLFDLDPAPFEAVVEQAKAQLAVDEAKLKLAEHTARRLMTLLKQKVASVQETDTAEAALATAHATLDLDKANLDQAKLNLSYTKVYAPASGWVTNVTMRVGNAAIANQPLFALISDNEFWIDANFKETDLGAIHSGQKANIEVDTYPNHSFSGIVESISGGSGTAFSLLPPENATGNWVKVTQRVPVRVRVLDPDPHFPLRIGTSVTVTIHL